MEDGKPWDFHTRSLRERIQTNIESAVSKPTRQRKAKTGDSQPAKKRQVCF